MEIYKSNYYVSYRSPDTVYFQTTGQVIDFFRVDPHMTFVV